jgi:DNA (cytosine-5)-methyltransferase 1
MSKPRALDLFCCAGGASMGLHRAGFDVVGVDIKPQQRYPFEFHQADALTFPLEGFDFIWASPPCQHYSQMTPKAHRDKHPDLIAEVRGRLAASGLPFAIENVPSAARRLRSPVMLCGSMFGLRVQRHRFIETSFYTMAPTCQHGKAPVLITGTHRRTYEPRYEYTAQECRDAADIQWMTRKELDQAIPPAYGEFIGRAAIAHIEAERLAA